MFFDFRHLDSGVTVIHVVHVFGHKIRELLFLCRLRRRWHAGVIEHDVVLERFADVLVGGLGPGLDDARCLCSSLRARIIANPLSCSTCITWVPGNFPTWRLPAPRQRKWRHHHLIAQHKVVDEVMAVNCCPRLLGGGRPITVKK